jgi:hypothetical protein
VIRRMLTQLRLRSGATAGAARELELLLAEPVDSDSLGDASGDVGTRTPPA